MKIQERKLASLSFNRNNKNNKDKKRPGAVLRKVQNQGIQPQEVITSQRSYVKQAGESQIISGYFLQEKSYKEMVVARVNKALCSILAFLVVVCLVSYYFVTMGEVKLNQIRKETLTLNYENEDLQNKLDNLQSYYNVDRAVAKSNILQRATKVVELSAAQIPSVDFDKQDNNQKKAWSMGY